MPARRRQATLALALLVTLGISACSGDATPTATTITPSTPVLQPGAPGEANATLTGAIEVPEFETNEADTLFVKSMIVHHAQALEMVELVEDQLEDEQTRTLAERIKAAQKPEIGGLVAWLVQQDEVVPPEAVDAGVDVEGLGGKVGARGRGGHDHGGADGMSGMATQEQLDALAAATGTEADIMFLELMSAHHEGALDMATEHARNGIHVLVMEMSNDMYVEQATELDRMDVILERLRG